MCPLPRALQLVLQPPVWGNKQAVFKSTKPQRISLGMWSLIRNKILCNLTRAGVH